MEGIHSLKDLLKEEDWIAKVDLKDAYFTVLIYIEDRPVLHFSTQDHNFQLTHLPFSLSCASWVFTKTLKPMLTSFREMEMRLVACIDYILVMAMSEKLARDHAQGLIYLQ